MKVFTDEFKAKAKKYARDDFGRHLNKATDIATNTAISGLAIAGAGILAPSVGVATGILAGTSGLVVAGVYTVKTIKTLKG